jgi:hypothetical protein
MISPAQTISMGRSLDSRKYARQCLCAWLIANNHGTRVAAEQEVCAQSDSAAQATFSAKLLGKKCSCYATACTAMAEPTYGDQYAVAAAGITSQAWWHTNDFHKCMAAWLHAHPARLIGLLCIRKHSPTIALLNMPAIHA